MEKISVKNSGIIRLDQPADNLFVGETCKQIPFDIKRFYVIDKPRGVRGNHAHKKLEQYIFCLRGQFDLELDDGEKSQTISMNDPSTGIRLGTGLWHSMKNFSNDCLILVVASGYYDEADYIRDYDEFKKSIR